MGDVIHTIDGHVATITLRNESRRNAMSLSMWQGLASVLGELDANADVRAIVLRGAGDKAFVSGADISEFGEKRDDPASVAIYNEAVAAAQGGLSAFRCPVIAAVSGVCYGGGLGLMLACDLRYGAPNATFRMPAARMGLGYGYEGLKRMVALLGATQVAEMFYTARVYDASAALRNGLLGAVQDDVFEHADKTAREIAANAPLTVEAAKQTIAAIVGGDDSPDSLAKLQQAVDACFSSSDYKEGRAAFAEKRLPRFTGT
jgi:enoyl-CoA hydratase